MKKEFSLKAMEISTETVIRAFFGTIYPKAPFHFLRILFNTCIANECKLLTGDLIAQSIREFISNEYKIASSFDIVVLFSLFCPELEENDIETYTKMKEKYEIEVQQTRFSSEYCDLFEDVDSTLKPNDWSLQKRLCRHKGKFKSLSWYIRRDEWQKVKSIVIKPGFSKLEPIKLSIFEPPILKNASLLSSDSSIRMTLPTPLDAIFLIVPKENSLPINIDKNIINITEVSAIAAVIAVIPLNPNNVGSISAAKLGTLKSIIKITSIITINADIAPQI